MKEETKKEKAFSKEARAEAVARFAEAMNREDIDGFMFGVSARNGNLCAGATGDKAVLTHIMSYSFVQSKLDLNKFIKGAVLHALACMEREEDDND